jgi:peptidoglycan hydrolase CwlO-like protein
MKKLLVIVIFLSIVNLLILLRVNNKINFSVDDFALTNKCDTVINKVLIDSIEYVIKSKDSIINKIKYDTKEYSEKIDALDDDANVKLFKELVSN